ncbi:hypothetical protein [Phyllobacterium zundukense]|uniref:Uncharacterized protein n=1 Tax=Phyllobacterium zundukense TaxID=1867719 RepID=A0ACD4CVU5_9HYPH|nr:hypothetical protein [Phyllobacterium zundukense]UXN57715.1 hypothetical protein N8E88_02585 [Phyllobacterium zundukense]
MSKTNTGKQQLREVLEQDPDHPVEIALRKAKTLGQLERLAGIETQQDRAAFWLQFASLRNRASVAGKAELKRIIRNKARSDDYQATLPPERKRQYG